MNRLTVANGELAWRESGTPHAPTVIWVHGLPLDSRSWALQEKHFADLSHNVFLDLRGYGQSSKLPELPTDITQLYADDIHALIQHLGLTDVVLVGFASAGHVALRYAAQHPDVVSQLITINGSPRFRQGPNWPWGFDDETIQRFVHRGRTGGVQALTDAVLAPDLVFRDVNAATADRLREWFEPMALNAGLATLLGFFDVMSRDDDRDLLASITAHTLIISSTAGKKVPSQVGLFLREHIPNSTLAELPGVDHFAFATRPVLVNALIEQTILDSSPTDGPS